MWDNKNVNKRIRKFPGMEGVHTYIMCTLNLSVRCTELRHVPLKERK